MKLADCWVPTTLQFRRDRIHRIAVLIAVSSYAAAAVAQQNEIQPVEIVSDTRFTSNFSNKVILPTDTLKLTFNHSMRHQHGQFAVLNDDEDITANFIWESASRLTGHFTDMPLPVGVHKLKLYTIHSDNTWHEIAQATLTVKQASEVTAIYTPTLILGAKSQLHELHSPAATPPIRPTYIDGTLQAGLQTDHHTDDWSINSTTNLAGTTYRPETVNYSALGSESPKVDVATYVVDGRFNSDLGVTGLSLGAVNVGTNPLLVNGLSNRGVLFNHRFNSRIDMSAAAQNGSYIVGRQNILGLNDVEHRLITTTTGVEVLPRLGAFRVEASTFKGVVKPVLSTGIATLQDAEESNGWAVRSKIQNESNSLRLDLDYSNSRYTPRGDSILNIAPGPSSTGNTWFTDVGYDVLKGKKVGNNLPLSVTLNLRHEYADFGYKSIGAGAGSDYASDTLNVSSSLGLLSSQLQFGRRADNVDNVLAFLKNRSHTFTWSVAAPFGQMYNDQTPPKGLPTVNYSYSMNHNYADHNYVPMFQTLANLGDVNVLSHNLGLAWQVDGLSLSYQLSSNLQDNSQIGFETQDVRDIGHSINTSYIFNQYINVSGGVSKRTSEQLDTGFKRFNFSTMGGLNWLIQPRYSLSSNLNYSQDTDSLSSPISTSVQAQLQLVKQFDIQRLGKKLPAQWSTSYTQSNSLNSGLIARYQTFNFAFNLSFF